MNQSKSRTSGLCDTIQPACRRDRTFRSYWRSVNAQNISKVGSLLHLQNSIQKVLRPFPNGPSVVSLGLSCHERKVVKGGLSAGNRGHISTALNSWHQSKHYCIAAVTVFYVTGIKACTKSFILLQNIKLQYCKLNHS